MGILALGFVLLQIYSQLLFKAFKRYCFSERDAWRIFQIAYSLCRDRVSGKCVTILQARDAHVCKCVQKHK